MRFDYAGTSENSGPWENRLTENLLTTLELFHIFENQSYQDRNDQNTVLELTDGTHGIIAESSSDAQRRHTAELRQPIPGSFLLAKVTQTTGRQDI